MNLAKRLEVLNKEHNKPPLFVEVSSEAAGSGFPFRKVALTPVRG